MRNESIHILSEEEVDCLTQERSGRELLRSYQAFCNENDLIELKRETLMKASGITKDTTDSEAFALIGQALNSGTLLDEDENVLRRYRKCRRLKGIVDTALSERIDGPRIAGKRCRHLGFTLSDNSASQEKAARAVEVLKDIYCHGMTVKEVVDKYGISCTTVTRIKWLGEKAVEDEIMLHLALHRKESAILFDTEPEGY